MPLEATLAWWPWVLWRLIGANWAERGAGYPNACGVRLSVAPVPLGLEIDADRPILAAAVANLLQNAFKFSKAYGHVSLTTSATKEHILFAIEDECGGLPAGKAEELFGVFTQRSSNRKGLGLGLAISRKGIQTSGGELSVRDLPGKGCVFTISLPRALAAEAPPKAP